MIPLLLAILPLSEVREDAIDLIEVNHFYDDGGGLVLEQLIFWQWSKDAGTFRVVAWRLLNRPSQRPQRDFNRGGVRCVWRDGEILRCVRASAMVETWTQYDPEVVDRQYLKRCERRGLRK